MHEAEKPLLAWQAEALESWRSQECRGIVQAVTGTGKTRIGIDAIKVAVSEGRRAAVLVPTIVLQAQWRAQLVKVFPSSVRVGNLGGGAVPCTLDTHDVVVAVVNAAATTPLCTTSGHLLVADECHRYAAPWFGRALREEFTERLGLTATLDRSDGKEILLKDYFGEVCFDIGYQRALVDEVIAHYSVAMIGVPLTSAEKERYEELSDKIAKAILNLSAQYGVPTKPFHEFLRRVSEMAKDASQPGASEAKTFLSAVSKRVELIAGAQGKREAVTGLAPALKVANQSLLFSQRIAIATELASDLNKVGLVAESTHGPTPQAVVLSSFKKGKINVLSAVKTLDEGVDVPEVGFAVIVSASKTRRQMIQRMGRILRRKDDDGLARFAILYMQETSEDPALGGHEGFLKEVKDHADDYEEFSSDQLQQAVEFLAITRPLKPPDPRRMEGDPKRKTSSAESTDDDFDASDFYGV
jgi:RNA polymerase primary sigma factor